MKLEKMVGDLICVMRYESCTSTVCGPRLQALSYRSWNVRRFAVLVPPPGSCGMVRWLLRPIVCRWGPEAADLSLGHADVLFQVCAKLRKTVWKREIYGSGMSTIGDILEIARHCFNLDTIAAVRDTGCSNKELQVVKSRWNISFIDVIKDEYLVTVSAVSRSRLYDLSLLSFAARISAQIYRSRKSLSA